MKTVSSLLALLMLPSTALAWEYPFVDEQKVKLTWHRSDVTVGDVNGDGRDDIVACESYQGGLGLSRILWFQNKKKGKKFVERVIEGQFSYPHSVHLADLDGDKDLDVIATGQGQTEERNGGVQWFENLGKGKAWKNHSIHKNGFFGTVRTADFDGDGDLDVALVGRKANNVSNGLHIYENEDGKGREWSSPSQVDKHAVPPLDVIDFDGDGDMDLIGRSKDAFTVYINEDGPWKKKDIRGKGAQTPANFHVFDFDADGKQDIILGGSRQVSVFLNLGDGNFGDEEVIAPGNTIHQYEVVAGDVDLDGHNDIVVAYAYKTVWFSYDAEEEEFTRHDIGKGPRGRMYALLADFDGKGGPEFLTKLSDGYQIEWLWNKSKKKKKKKKK